MRILLLSEGDPETWDSWSGSAKSLVDHLRLAGHEVATADVDLYGLDRYLAAAGTYSPDRKRWWARYHLAGVAFQLRSRAAARAIARHRGRIDVILQIGATFAPLGRGAVPYTVYCDSSIAMSQRGAATGFSDAFSLRSAELEGVRAREAAVYRGAARVFAMSDYLRASFRDDFGIPEARLQTVHAGLNLDLARVPWPRRPHQGPPTVLFVGRQFERKGGDVLLRAFAAVRRRLPDARLVVIGPPSLPEIPEGVEFVGFLDKSTPAGWGRLLEAYASADVFCLPTRFEPFGIAFLEAMFFGLPCLGTDAWAVPEMVREGETGLLVPSGDADALADRLLALLADEPRRVRMGLAGRRLAESHFTWSAVVGRMTEGLRHLEAPVAAVA